MKKILVPVDFSANSRKAIRFAIQLASQTNSEITFFHLIDVLLATTDGAWDSLYYTRFHDDEMKRSQNHLAKLIEKVYKPNLPARVKYNCVCQMATNTGSEILFYAKEQKIDFICVGASGMGFFSKLFGTVATHLMINSPIPVFIIPKNYRHKPVADICYSSDMANPEPEIKAVLNLADALHAMVSVVHFDYETGLKENMGKLDQLAQTFKKDNIRFRYKKLNALYPLRDHLRKFIVQSKPSLLILFTRQDRNWFDRLLISSNSVDMSFGSKIPLLIFRKTES
jgi:nucleotide-binding universal stress UspA family protein